MARCPKLDYESNGYWGNSNDKYICTVTGIKMDVDDPKVKCVCKVDYGEAYMQCEAYKRSR